MVLLRPLDLGDVPRNVRASLKGRHHHRKRHWRYLKRERVYIRAERDLLPLSGAPTFGVERLCFRRRSGREVVVDSPGKLSLGPPAHPFYEASDREPRRLSMAKPSRISRENIRISRGLRYGPVSKEGRTASPRNKMTDYYIKRAEQLRRPNADRCGKSAVDIVFTKTVKIEEKEPEKEIRQLAAREGAWDK